MRTALVVLAGVVLTAGPEYKGPGKPVRATIPCTVAKVSDGDTIVCGHMGRVRLLGIDAPELSQKPFGKQSQGALAAMIPVGTTVQLEQDVQVQDRNGRLLAYVWRDGRLVNWEMLRAGWVVTLTYAPNVQYVDALLEAADKAEQEGLGYGRPTGSRACRLIIGMVGVRRGTATA